MSARGGKKSTRKTPTQRLPQQKNKLDNYIAVKRIPAHRSSVDLLNFDNFYTACLAEQSDDGAELDKYNASHHELNKNSGGNGGELDECIANHHELNNSGNSDETNKNGSSNEKDIPEAEFCSRAACLNKVGVCLFHFISTLILRRFYFTALGTDEQVQSDKGQI